MMLAAAVSAQKLDNPCKGVKDKMFARDLTNCARYYYCENGQATLGERKKIFCLHIFHNKENVVVNDECR